MARFAHLTDLHVSAPGAGLGSGPKPDTAGTLRRAVEMIAGIEPLPDFVVVSGDLTDHGDEASYALVKEILDELPVPRIIALGNHDRRAGYHAVFGDGPSDRPLSYQQMMGGVQVIVLDSLVPMQVGGSLDQDQIDFLEDALQQAPDVPKLIVVHHPPQVDPSSLPWTTLDPGSTERFSAALQGYPVIGICSGHVHFDRVSLWQGIPIVISTGLHSTVDLSQPRALRLVEGSGFALCQYRPSGLSAAFVRVTPETRELRYVEDIRRRGLPPRRAAR